MSDYLPILVMSVLVVAFVMLSFVASQLLAPSRPNSAKQAPYECGIVPDREPADRFPVRFYLVAMIFIIFDIEIIFLYPWAVVFHQLGPFGLWEMVAFAVAVSGQTLAMQILKRRLEMAFGSRTTDSTVRRISRGDTTEAA